MQAQGKGLVVRVGIALAFLVPLVVACGDAESPQAPKNGPESVRKTSARPTLRVRASVGSTATVAAQGRFRPFAPQGQENDAGLCYPTCQAGYYGVGPVGWRVLPRRLRR